MNNLGKSLLLLAATTVGLLSLPSVASAFTVTRQPDTFTDNSFRNLLSSGQFTEKFVAETRGGNGLPNGTRELGINTATGTPVAQGQFAWINGKAEDFILEYTGSKVNYTVGGQLLSSEAFSGPVTDIFLRTRAENGSIMFLSDLFLNGTSLGSLASTGAGGTDVDYLTISQLSGGFTLTGKSTMTWTGSIPTESKLAYQIKVGTSPTQSVPEPGTVAALLLTGIAAAGFGTKKKAAN